MIEIKRQAAYALAIFALLIWAGLVPFAQQPPAGKTIATLEPDENIEYPESTIVMSAESEDVVLVTTKGTGQNAPHYVFRDGKKTGPYATFDLAMKAAYSGRAGRPSRGRDCAVYKPGHAPEDAQVTTGDAGGGKQIVRFKGKTFGPHVLVFGARATPDGAAAYYTASDNDKAWLGCSDGRAVSFGGLPTDFKFSPDGRNAAAIVQGKLSMGQMGDLSKLPSEKLQDALKEQEKKYLYTIDGKCFGPFEGSFSEGSFWYASTSNDLYYRTGDDVFRNGVKMLTSVSFDDCSFYPAPDGKKYAMFTYEKIVFSDGQTFPSALDIVAVKRQGTIYFRWITLEENRKLVVYEKPM